MVKNLIFKGVGYLIGALSALLIIIGILEICLPKQFSLIAGIVIIVVSIASGLICLSPISVVGLFIGIFMCFVPKTIMGIIVIVIGVIGCAIVPPITIKVLKFINSKPKKQKKSFQVFYAKDRQK